MNTFNVYSVEYSAGLGGTWLTGFINLHLGIENLLIFNPKERDYLLDDPSPIVWYYEEQTFEELVKQHDKPFAYKITPHHMWIDYPESNNFRPTQMEIPPNNTTKRFMPIINETLRQEFIDRRVFQVRLSQPELLDNPSFIKDPQQFAVDTMINEFKRIIKEQSQTASNIVTIDIGKLMNNDNNEYNRLLTHLDAKPLKNKAKLVSEYRQDALGQVGYGPLHRIHPLEKL